MDAFENQTMFNKKEKDSIERINQIQASAIDFATHIGLYYQNPNYAIYLATFLFPREMLDALNCHESLLQGLFSRWYNKQMFRKITTIAHVIVRFSSAKLKEFLSIKEMNYLLYNYLDKGAEAFISDEFFSDIWVELKKHTESRLSIQ